MRLKDFDPSEFDVWRSTWKEALGAFVLGSLFFLLLTAVVLGVALLV